jgi:hypothetical protein
MTETTASETKWLTPGKIAWSLFLLMLAVFIVGRFVGPRIPDDQAKRWCAVNVHVTAVFGVSLNCDSPEFMRDATHLSALLEPGSPLQTRPGMPFAAWLIGLPLHPLAALVPGMVKKAERADIDPNRIQNALQSFGPAYVAYFVLNVLILTVSFYQFRRIYQAGRPADETAAAAVVDVSVATLMIATYPLTNFILSPHTQMLNTLVPLWAVVCAMRANDGALMDVRFAVSVGAVVGLATTAYAVFPVVTITVLLFAALDACRDWPKRWHVTLVRNAAILMLLSVMPIILWYVYVRMETGQFHNNEVIKANSLIWIVTALRQGPSDLLAEFLHRLRFYWRGVISLLPMIAVMVMLTAGFLIAARARIWDRKAVYSLLSDVLPTIGIALVVSLLFFGFYICVGQFQVRHSYAAIPPLVAALAVLATTLTTRLPASWRRSYAGACAAVAVVTLAHGIAEGAHIAGAWFD